MVMFDRFGSLVQKASLLSWIIFFSAILIDPQICRAEIALPSAEPAAAPAPVGYQASMDSVRTPEEQKGLPVDELKKLIEEETGEKGIEGTNYQRRKRPRVAMMCALVFPGLGQVYNEKPFKAVLALAAETFYLSQILHNYRLEKREEKIRDSYPRFITIEGEEPVTVPGYDWSHHDAWVEEYRERQVDWIWWSAGCILVLVLDAYVDAHLDDMNFKIEGAATEGTAGLSLVIDF